MVTSSNPLGLQPLPLYFPCGKHMGRKCYPLRVLLLRQKNIRTYFLQVVYFSSSARRDRGLLRLSESRAVLARAMPSVSNLVDRQLSPCDGGVLVHNLIMCLYVLKILFLKSTSRFATTLLIFSYVPACGNVVICKPLFAK